MERINKNKSYPDVLRVQAVLTPCRGDAAVEVRPRSTHVQLVLVGLGCDVISHVGASKQELREDMKKCFSCEGLSDLF